MNNVGGIGQQGSSIGLHSVGGVQLPGAVDAPLFQSAPAGPAENSISTGFALQAIINAAIKSPFSLLLAVENSVSTGFTLKFVAENSVSTPFELNFTPIENRVLTSFNLSTGLLSSILTNFSLNSEILGSVSTRFNLNQNYQSEAAVKTSFAMQDDSAAIDLPIDAKIELNGIEIDIYTAQISQDEQSWTWDFNATIADQKNWDDIGLKNGYYPQIVLSVRGVVIQLMVEGKSRSRKDVNDSWSIRGRGISARLDGKFAVGVGTKWRNISAKDIIQELCTAASIPLDYQEVDYQITELDGQGRYPIDIIKEIANATQAVIQTATDGTLIIRPLYKVKPTEYETVIPDFEINDMDDYVSLDEQWLDRDNYNIVSIGNSEVENESDTSISIQSEDIEGTGNKLCKIYTVPFVSQIQLEDSAESGLSLVYQGVNTAEVEIEYIEIIDGSASVSLPCYGITRYEYIHTNLGGITITESGEISTAVAGQSLLKLSYTTKFHQYEASRTGDDKFLQIFAEIEGE